MRVITDRPVCGNAAATERLMREHTAVVLKAVQPLVNNIVDARLNAFSRFGGYRFRRYVGVDGPMRKNSCAFPVVREFDAAHGAYRAIEDKKTKHGVAATELFGGDNEAPPGLRRSRAWRCLTKDIVCSGKQTVSDRLRQCCAVRTQDDYGRYVMFSRRCNSDSIVPMAALNPFVMCEEDGRSNGVMEVLAKVDAMVVAMIYNPPWRYERPYMYVTSGSDTQSLVIDSAASPLQLIMARVMDTVNTQVWRGEFYRRATNDLSSDQMRMFRTMCMSLERDLPMAKTSLMAMMFREIFPQNTLDPIYHTTGGRFFFSHKDVSAFNQTMVDRGRADVDITDLVDISSDVVLVHHDELPRSHDPANPYDVSLKSLSTLTAGEAARNRMKLWHRKLQHLVGADHITALPPKIGGVKASIPLDHSTADQPTTLGTTRVGNDAPLNRADVESLLPSASVIDTDVSG